MEIFTFLKEKKEVLLDAPETTLLHRAIILRKPFLKKVYIRWYLSILKEIEDLPEGILLEIGSGGSLVFRFIQFIEWLLAPLNRRTALFQTITVKNL